MNIIDFIKKCFTIQEPPKVERKKVKPPKYTLPQNVSGYVVSMADMGRKWGWRVIDWQKNISMLSMWRDEVRLNIYTSTMTVGTCLNHPTQGRTQLFRKNVTLEELEVIFKKPRVHTGKGYQKKVK
jgi:hypothetical protein